MKEKHIPLRKCIACGEMKPKAELIRIYANADGIPDIDASGKLGGRGAYICRGEACIEKAKKTKRIEKVIGCGYDDMFHEKLKAECAKSE